MCELCTTQHKILLNDPRIDEGYLYYYPEKARISWYNCGGEVSGTDIVFCPFCGQRLKKRLGAIVK